MLHDIVLFIYGLSDHWLSIATGGVVYLIWVIAEIGYGKTVTWKHVIWVMALALLVSSFLTWRDEHQHVSTLEARLPDSQQLKVAPVRIQESPFDRDSGGRFIARGLIFPNKPVRHAQLDLACNLYSDFIGINAGIFPNLPGSGISQVTGKDRAHLEVYDWTPTTPVVFLLFLNGPPALQDYCEVNVASAE